MCDIVFDGVSVGLYSTYSLISTACLCWIPPATVWWINLWLKCFQDSTPIHLHNQKKLWTGEFYFYTAMSRLSVILVFHFFARTVVFLCFKLRIFMIFNILFLDHQLLCQSRTSVNWSLSLMLRPNVLFRPCAGKVHHSILASPALLGVLFPLALPAHRQESSFPSQVQPLHLLTSSHPLLQRATSLTSTLILQAQPCLYLKLNHKPTPQPASSRPSTLTAHVHPLTLTPFPQSWAHKSLIPPT